MVISTPTSQDLEAAAKEEWIGDSGASSHMSHSSTSMEQYRSLSPSVHIGDDSTLPVVGMGDISLGDAVLHDVLHVPRISSPSQKQLQKVLVCSLMMK